MRVRRTGWCAVCRGCKAWHPDKSAETNYSQNAPLTCFFHMLCSGNLKLNKKHSFLLKKKKFDSFIFVGGKPWQWHDLWPGRGQRAGQLRGVLRRSEWTADLRLRQDHPVPDDEREASGWWGNLKHAPAFKTCIHLLFEFKTKTFNILFQERFWSSEEA